MSEGLQTFQDLDVEKQKEHVFEGLKLFEPCTSRELYNYMGFNGFISSLRARLSELEDEERVFVSQQRRCRKASSSQEVNEYKVEDCEK